MSKNKKVGNTKLDITIQTISKTSRNKKKVFVSLNARKCGMAVYDDDRDIIICMLFLLL